MGEIPVTSLRRNKNSWKSRFRSYTIINVFFTCSISRTYGITGERIGSLDGTIPTNRVTVLDDAREIWFSAMRQRGKSFVTLVFH